VRKHLPKVIYAGKLFARPNNAVYHISMTTRFWQLPSKQSEHEYEMANGHLQAASRPFGVNNLGLGYLATAHLMAT